MTRKEMAFLLHKRRATHIRAKNIVVRVEFFYPTCVS